MTGPRRLLAAVVIFAASAVAATQAVAQTARFTATVTSDNADLRARASSGATVVDHVFKGTKLPAFGLSPDKQWVRVKGPDGSAWIQRSAVAVTRGAPSAAESSSSHASRPAVHETSHAREPERGGLNGPKRYCYVVASKTNVLLNASDSSPTLAVAAKNDVFEMGGFSRDKQYVKVRTSDGRIGWIEKSALHPGRPATTVATREKPTHHKAEPEDTPRPRPTPDEPFRPTRPRNTGGSDTRIWADGGMLLFHEKVTSNEGYGYDLSGSGFGAGVRYERRLSGPFWLEGGYFGTVNQRLPAKGSNTTVFSTTHRLDISARYTYEFGGNEDGPKISALAGIQNYTFYIQPQSLDFFYSQVYNSAAIGLGGEYPFGGFHAALDARYFIPVLAGERYGSGQAGGDGQSSKSVGYSIGASGRYQFYSGASLGLNLRLHSYATNWSGVGLRGVEEGGTVVAKKITGVQVIDEFTTVSLTYARGF